MAAEPIYNGTMMFCVVKLKLTFRTTFSYRKNYPKSVTRNTKRNEEFSGKIPDVFQFNLYLIKGLVYGLAINQAWMVIGLTKLRRV